jgi:hypothetical protein
MKCCQQCGDARRRVPAPYLRSTRGSSSLYSDSCVGVATPAIGFSIVLHVFRRLIFVLFGLLCRRRDARRLFCNVLYDVPRRVFVLFGPLFRRLFSNVFHGVPSLALRSFGFLCRHHDARRRFSSFVLWRPES